MWRTHDLSVVNETCELTQEERTIFEDEAVHLFAENAPAGARNGYKAGTFASCNGTQVLRVASRDNFRHASREKADN